MMSKSSTTYQRPLAAELRRRLIEPRRFIQVVAGPRQVGKTTLVQQLADEIGPALRYASADEPTLRGTEWIAQHWDAARLVARESGDEGTVLALDEIQKIQGWSETVKRLWDEDTRRGLPLRVVLLGSAPLLIARGMTESLAGRFEVLQLPHWSYAEMRDAFGFDLDQYLYFGGYPGAAPLAAEPQRWRRYITDSLIETSISRDVLLLTRVDKPALLRRLFELACRYSGQILSYTKMLGQLQDAGNTTTLAHYLDLLACAGMVRGLQKFTGDAARSRGSSPKLQVLNTALMNATTGLMPDEAICDPEYRGRLVESAVGAHLANAAACGECELFYWRERSAEVDFVVRAGRRFVAIEVKSTATGRARSGAAAFAAAFRPDRTLLVGGDGIALDDFLTRPVLHWLQT
ncbi:AAA family ATPase [Halorhodospira abdelmalekii]|uniref:ATP-binding protein n=1 Tax=Halorhodospira abdelmalekii TaxID=421629 RepID=UPI001908679C|nr:ATP-binding protein [Halorhodospira abdelmalekii]MBK1736056.1 AAA family ATPase [Halorhodospira abdelmalekii]